MSLPRETACTIEDIYALPDGQRAELIDGQIYMMAPPTRIHQELVVQFSRIIGNHIASKKGECRIYPAPFAVNLDANDKDWVEPDISVVCNPSKLTDKGCSGAPDLIIEILSPTSRKRDYITKNSLYSDAGVREYWIVDPKKEITVVYHLEDDAAPTVYPFNSPVSFRIFPELTVTISNLLVNS